MKLNFKSILKMAVQIVASIYASSYAHRIVGDLFDRIIGTSNKKGDSR
jgi:hypothetical protein